MVDSRTTMDGMAAPLKNGAALAAARYFASGAMVTRRKKTSAASDWS